MDAILSTQLLYQLCFTAWLISQNVALLSQLVFIIVLLLVVCIFLSVCYAMQKLKVTFISW